MFIEMSPLLHMNCVQTADFETLNLQNKIISSEAIREKKLKLSRNVHNITFYKTFGFVVIARMHSSLWQQCFHIVILGKAKIGLFAISLQIF